MKKIQDFAAGFFIICVIFLSVISVLSVWKIFSADIFEKSFQTIGLLAVVAAIVLVAGKFIGKDSRNETESIQLASPAFSTVRGATVVFLIALVVLFAFVGALSIWELLDGEIVQKSLSSIAIIAFGAFVVIIACLQREGKLSSVHSAGSEAGLSGTITDRRAHTIFSVVSVVSMIFLLFIGAIAWFFAALIFDW